MSDGTKTTDSVRIHQPAPDHTANPSSLYLVDIAAQIKAEQEKRARDATQREDTRVSLTGHGYDQDIYGSGDKFAGYTTSLPMDDDEEEDELAQRAPAGTNRLSSYTAPKEVYSHLASVDDDDTDPFAGRTESSRIADREDEYHKRRTNRVLSPSRQDPFAKGEAGSESRSYAEVMKEAELEREQQRVMQKIAEKKKEAQKATGQDAPPPPTPTGRKRRWDVATPIVAPAASSWNEPDDHVAVPSNRWEETPKADVKKRNRWDETPVASSTSSWDATPRASSGAGVAETPTTKRSRWDETPVAPSGMFGATPSGQLGMMTPNMAVPMTPEAMSAQRWEHEIDMRNRPLTDEDLDAMFPTTGYRVLAQPASYQPIRTPGRKLTATPTPYAGNGFMMQDENMKQDYGIAPTEIEVPGGGNLPFFKQEDMQHFGKLLDEKDESSMSAEDIKERKIMRLLLKIKNGTPPMRKAALRTITDKARDFGPGPLFNQILPLLMSPTLEDQERHLLVKVIDRIMYKLDDLVRPFVHKILVVIEPLLIDEDYYARVEGREIISNLSKAAGLATMIATMRPDIDHADEYVRNTTARAFSVVASALGIPALLPFLKAVCNSKKSWQARHTGIKIVQQIAILLGCAILPHLKNLVDAIAHGLEVRRITD